MLLQRPEWEGGWVNADTAIPSYGAPRVNSWRSLLPVKQPRRSWTSKLCWLPWLQNQDGEPGGGLPARNEQDGLPIKSTEDLRIGL